MIAIIDLGSNTFHLLVGSLDENGRLDVVHKDRRFVHLSEKGVDVIHEQIMDRALGTLRDFKGYCTLNGIDEIRAFGTETLRKASNADQLIHRAESELGISIQIIDGAREADFIAKGVILASDKITPNALIVDIGGGSVEFILTDDDCVPIESFSYPVGSSVMYQRFHKNEPITTDEMLTMYAFLDLELRDVVDSALKHQTNALIGASGTFEILKAATRSTRLNPHYEKLNIEDCHDFIEEISALNLERRKQDDRIPKNRAMLMSTALTLISWMISRMKVTEVFYSDYAMKEGILWSLCSTHKDPIEYAITD